MEVLIYLNIHGNRVYINGGPHEHDETIPLLDIKVPQIMKFRPQGYEYSEKYKNGDWDGWINLYKPWNHSFPRGFLNEVELLLNIMDIKYEIGRPQPRWSEKGALPQIAVSLRPYQQETVGKAVIDKRGIICLPTGTGKTLCAAEIIQRLQLPTVVFVHKKELMEQWIDNFCKYFPLDRDAIGRIGDGETKFAFLTVAMVQTFGKLPSNIFEKFPVVFFDECHHVAAETVFELADHTKGEYLYGLSATPYRADGKDLMIRGALGDFIVNYGLSEMITRGYLAKPRVVVFDMEPRLYPRRAKFADVYRDYIVDNERRNHYIATLAKGQFEKGKSVYIHVKQIRHGEILHQMLPGSEWVNGKNKLDLRRGALWKFAHEGGILISTLLGEGVDVPGMDVLILACGGLSEVFVRQLIGRVLRITADKQNVIIYDFNDIAKYLADHSQKRIEIYRSESEFRVEHK